MKKIAIYLVLLGLLFGLETKAQNSELRWGLGLHPSSLSFYALKNGLVKPKEYGNGIQFSLARYYNPSFDLGLETAFASVRHPDSDTLADTGKLPRALFFDLNPFIKYKFNNGYLLREDHLLSPYVKAGFGLNKHKASTGMGFYIPLEIGLNLRVTESAFISLQTGYKIGSHSYLHHSVGFIINIKGRNTKKITPELGDADKDGIPDYLDRCPRIRAEGSTTGCPDLDRDGVLDLEDLCPTVKGFSNLQGCLDADMDGIPDPKDKCPSDFGSASNKGCPLKIADRDEDLISDENDLCPDKAGVFTAGGCPDADKDGVADDKDDCPDLFGDKEFKGCPYNAQGMSNLKLGINPDAVSKSGNSSTTLDPVPMPTPSGQPEPDPLYSRDNPCGISNSILSDIGHAIQFDSDKAKIKLETKAELDKIVTLLQECTSNLLIRAHTDGDGDADYNMRLSERRAYAISRHLTRQGINRSRIKTEGLGETEPLMADDTPEGKAYNRRIEFILVE